MPTLKVVYKGSTKEAQVLDAGVATPGGFTHIGDLVHPDETYPDSTVIYHGVRDLLYKRSAANPANPAFWPDNIVNMQEISITNQATPRLRFLVQVPPFLQLKQGDRLVLEPTFTGGKAPFTYEWMAGSNSSDYETLSLVVDPVDKNFTASWYLKITDANGTTITSDVCEVNVVETVILTSLALSPTTADLDLSADITNGKDYTIIATPGNAFLGTLMFNSEPNPAVATATIVGNVVNIKPVAVGSTMLEIAQGGIWATIAITVVA